MAATIMASLAGPDSIAISSTVRINCIAKSEIKIFLVTESYVLYVSGARLLGSFCDEEDVQDEERRGIGYSSSWK